MHLFLFRQFKYLIKDLKELPNLNIGKFDINRFPNQELYIKLYTNVANKECLIMSSITPPEENLFSTLLLSHTLKKDGATTISALLPYLAYTRQDKEKRGESLAAASVGELLLTSHINEIITIDLHSHKAEDLFPLLIHNLSTAKLFAKEINKLKLKNPTFIAPDEGSIERVEKVMEEFGKKAELAFMKKKRTTSGINSILFGHINKDVIIIDDMLDTGKTLIACCEKLKLKGAENIYIFVTHGLFTGKDWQDLFNLNVKNIYCTNSIPDVQNLKYKGINIISIKPLLEEYFYHIKKLKQELNQFYKGFREGRVIEPEETPIFEL
ncbi:MAG: ribose-phosphate diphosphokinase [Candidatus Daviesbacteria bacterium]|nr:ribose-phosphate diphosphokinase [Candidatus Daviesbacteria bacterium]